MHVRNALKTAKYPHKMLIAAKVEREQHLRTELEAHGAALQVTSCMILDI